MAVDTLTRETGLERLIAPNGRQFEISRSRVNPALVGIAAIGDKGGGVFPDELKGLFTKESYAREHLLKYLNKFWDISDEASKKSR